MKTLPLGYFRSSNATEFEPSHVWRWRSPLGKAVAVTLLLGSVTGCAHAGRAAKAEGAVLSLEVAGADGALAEDADVFVDGQYVGTLGEVRDSVRLAPGTHRVEIRRSGSFPVQQTVEVEASRAEVRQSVRGRLLPDPLD